MRSCIAFVTAPQARQEASSGGEDDAPLAGQIALTVAEFGRLAGIKRVDAQALTIAGQVRAMLIGGGTLIPSEAARAFVTTRPANRDA